MIVCKLFMIIGGFQKFSMIDYPGKISAVIFTQGCNFKCRFCYNPALIARKKRGSVSEKEVLDFLRDRRHKLEGVVITGGEPTLQPDLSEFLRKASCLTDPIR